VNPPKTFDTDEPDLDTFESLPDWIQGLIKDNLEYPGSALEAALEGDTEAPTATEDNDQDEDLPV